MLRSLLSRRGGPNSSRLDLHQRSKTLSQLGASVLTTAGAGYLRDLSAFGARHEPRSLFGLPAMSLLILVRTKIALRASRSPATTCPHYCGGPLERVFRRPARPVSFDLHLKSLPWAFRVDNDAMYKRPEVCDRRAAVVFSACMTCCGVGERIDGLDVAVERCRMQ